MQRVLRSVFLVALTTMAVAPTGRAQSPDERPTLSAKRLTEPVRLDGHLTESVWKRSNGSASFTQQDPVEGGPPSVPTRIWVAYDDEALYLAARLSYDDVSNITARKLRRDAGLGSDDRLMWILDTYNDGRTAYFFETNPAGLRGDGLLTTGQGVSVTKSWDTVWDVATARTESGWTAEIRIPFQSLQFEPSQTTWGFNVQRTVRRKNEELLWSGHGRDEGLFRPRYAGTLTGLTGLSQGLGLEVTPFGLASTDRDHGPAGTTENTADVGGEVSYSITPTIRSAVTVNTDFAEVEVDQRRVNLTRFPLFFPERRDFFLESSNLYEFAPRSSQYPFFSRRIGLVDGTPVPILAGARMNGRQGPYSFGVIHARTRQKEGVPSDSLTLPPEDFTAARVNRSFGAESKVGLIYTRRATHADAVDGVQARRNDGRFERLQDRHTLGVDLSLSTSQFLGDKNLQFQAFFVGHNAPLKRDTSSLGQRTTRGIRLNFPNDPWFAHVSYREFGTAYDPAVGFVFRRGFRRLQPTVSYQPTLETNDTVRRIGFALSGEYLTDLRLEPQTVSLDAELLEVEFESGDNVELFASRQFERLRRPFDIVGDGEVVLAPGTYTTYSGGIDLRSARYRTVSGDAELETGGFWSGRQTQVETGFTVRPLIGVSVGGEWEHTRANLDEGDFRTHVFRLDGTVDLSPDIALTTQVQFDNVSDRLGLFARMRWIVQPGSDLFVVLRRNWRAAGERLTPLQTSATAKLSYSVRF
jgi:hypothetical protein